eukprot:EG_transcript_16630
MRIICQNLNVHHLVAHSKQKGERTGKFAEVLATHAPDIVIVQEMFVLSTLFTKVGGDLRQQLILKAKDCGLQYCALSKPANLLFGQDAGLVILSKMSVAKEYSVTFREYGWKEAPNKKGFLHAKLKFPDADKFLHVITIHMDAHEQAARDNQVKQLRAHLGGHVSTDDYVIIGGNLNIPANTAEFKQLRNLLHPFRDGWGDQHPGTTDHGPMCVDYLFWSPNIKVHAQRLEDLDVSDHYCIIADFDLMQEDEARYDAPKPRGGPVPSAGPTAPASP